MKHHLSILSFALSLIFPAFFWFAPPAHADLSHARIIRLSLVQGDVRFTKEFHKDAMEDPKAVWEIAPLNLPIRQGYALATDQNSRAEVEFENGAMAFLSANTVMEFYDLSLDEGAHITRLILRQGSAIFYVHPAKQDYFSVTGGDFSVEANGRSRFRLDNYDDGSNVNVELGRVNVLREHDSRPLEKGQSYSLNLNEGSAPVIARATDSDDFDKWVSGRIDSVATATTYTGQYVNSPNYSAGFADLYTYGSFYNIPGYGFGWQPYGIGMGWNPFSFGSWYSDPFFGWNFIGSAPWGWLPYHYGGWIFSPVYGWCWIPSGFGFGRPLYYQSATAVWVRSGSNTGLVPLHPGDSRGKTPINLGHGVYPITGNNVAVAATPSTGEKWTVTKHPPHNALTPATLASSVRPVPVSRTILSTASGTRPAPLSHGSSIVYDPAQHRYVNSTTPPKVVNNSSETQAGGPRTVQNRTATVVPGTPKQPSTGLPPVPRGPAVAPARPHINPPMPSSPGMTSPHASGGAVWNGPSSGGSHSAPAPAPMPAPAHSSGGGSAGHH